MLREVADGVLAIVGVRRAAEAAYERLATLSDTIEIRRYHPVMVAEVSGLSRDRAFGALFRYISGANRSNSKIAMTTPVENSSQKIAMTTPVETAPAGTGDQGGGAVMRFFLPAQMTMTTAPAPTDPAVRLVEQPQRTLAVLRFTGVPGDLAGRERDLRTALVPTRYRPNGPAITLFYDPPFTLPFLRRNEIALPVETVEPGVRT